MTYINVTMIIIYIIYLVFVSTEGNGKNSFWKKYHYPYVMYGPLDAAEGL